ncbi:nitrogenase stabilizing/protective protein NifW [Frigidibacter sp.]|uniref:nitrogenase stabilizing/protective protein NifW n=1 Tax=Frigidibacter sp. TaxID=2586418 RepID=UPI0027376386|nr:nitrogenase stabilizing/protective protein NifW [Frigidibacter sp.]MDP3340360.1 nitrogenase stabilizing/protective protein NifW [Frigidibacter sp.]
MTQATPAPTLLDTLARLSAAEDLFDCLGLDYTPEVLNVSRLHVMKRFGAYLRETDFTGLDAEEVASRCRAALSRAHEDFVISSPLQEKVFKVFETKASERKAAFVSLDSLAIVKS